MATVTRFVNTASTAGGDGTTNGTAGGTRAYASLSEWESNEQTDLVTDTDTHIVNCSGTTADGTRAAVIGWTTGVSNFIIINGDNTTGAYSTSHFRIEVLALSSFYRMLIIEAQYTVLNDMQTKVTSDSTFNQLDCYRFTATSNNSEANRCIGVVNGPGTGFGRGFLVSANGDQILTNCLMYDERGLDGGTPISGGTGISSGSTGNDNTLLNCTALGFDESFTSGFEQTVARNCLSQDNTNLGPTGSGFTTLNFNASDLGAPGTNGIDTISLMTFADSGSGRDFRPQAGETADDLVIDAGENLFSTFTNDLAGNTRDNAAFTVGCLIEAAAPPVGDTLTAESGSYSYTGTATALLADKILSAEAGAYTYAGTDAALLAGFNLNAETGAYTYSGADAGLKAGATINAEPGVYAYIGTSVDFLKDSILSADSGVYAYNGANASLIFSGDPILLDGLAVDGTMSNNPFAVRGRMYNSASAVNGEMSNDPQAVDGEMSNEAQAVRGRMTNQVTAV